MTSSDPTRRPPPPLPEPAPAEPAPPEPPDPYRDEVRRKADRMARARREHSSAWISLAHAGIVGWQLVLPLIGGTLAGHLIGEAIGHRGPKLAGILVGLAMGLWQAGRSIRRGLEEP